METTESRTVTTNPFSGMVVYRIEYKGSVAVAYRICFEQQESFPFAITDFAEDILYLDRNRDGHVDHLLASISGSDSLATEEASPIEKELTL